MRSALTNTFFILLVAGCTSAPTTSDPLPEWTPTPAAPTFLEPVPIAAVSDSQGEFFLAASKDGNTLIACTHGAFTSSAPKYASEDAGRTWRPIVVDPPTGVAGDCYVEYGDDGTWYFLDSQVEATTVSSSRDLGRTWTVNRLTTPPLGGGADRPYIGAFAGSSVGLTYVQSYLAPGSVEFTRSDDHGATWTQPAPVSRLEPGRTNVMHAPMVVSLDRSVARVPLMRFGVQDYPTAGPAQAELGFAVSRDRGATWSHDVVLASVESVYTPPAVAWAAEGTIYWAFQVPDGTKQDIHVTVSTDQGETWSPPKRIAGGWDFAGYMWIDGAPDGTAVLSIDAEASMVDPEKRGEHLILFGLDAQHPDILAWAEPVAPAANAEFSTITIDDTGRRHAMFRNDGQWLYLGERVP